MRKTEFAVILEERVVRCALNAERGRVSGGGIPLVSIPVADFVELVQLVEAESDSERNRKNAGECLRRIGGGK